MTATVIAPPSYAELWDELVTVDRAIALAPACEHRHYRYEMVGCQWCELNRRADQIERALDRMARARMGESA